MFAAQMHGNGFALPIKPKQYEKSNNFYDYFMRARIQRGALYAILFKWLFQFCRRFFHLAAVHSIPFIIPLRSHHI